MKNQQQIAIGINEVTRVLERMKPNTIDQQQNLRQPPVQLQVNPRKKTLIDSLNNVLIRERLLFDHR